ncbi:hypothetical protein ACWDBW_16135 [Streptomyces sp. NPDC001107]
MDRFRTAAWAALPLLLPLLAAGPASASSSQPTPSLTYGSVRSVRPGDQLTIDAQQKRGEASNGDIMRSSAFITAGKMRMMDPLVTTTVTISCEAKPGTYPVLRRDPGDVRPEEHPFQWARVRVEPADEAARRACRDKVKKLPRPELEERWGPDAPWPQTEWDVRTFRAGSRIEITTDGVFASEGDSLTSRAFTDRPVLQDGKATLTATATLRCDATPGLYVIYRHAVDQNGPAKPIARLRVAPAADPEACQARQAAAHRTTAIAWAAGGALLVAAAGAAFLLRARSRRARAAATGPVDES